jgi:hypothetical protein
VYDMNRKLRLTRRGQALAAGLFLTAVGLLAHQHASDGHLEKHFGQVITVHEQHAEPTGMGPAMCGAEDPGQPCWSPTGGAVSQGPIGYTLDTCKDGQTSEWNAANGYGELKHGLWVCHPSK